jgi:GNAT superfamily N-acetyltransferase
MGLVRVTNKNRSQFGAEIEAIENESEYPIGDDFFQISHGADYFTFFERLGEVHYYVWEEHGIVAAVAAGIKRKLTIGGTSRRAWYLCDLKVRPNYRGQHIPLRLLTRALPFNYLRCPRGYAISMDPSHGASNRTAKLLMRYRWLRFGASVKLLIWSLDKRDMLRAIPIIEKHRGPVSFLSLRGIKDIVLKSSGQPMDLLHAQFGPLGNGREPAQDGATHMFCVPERDPLAIEVKKELALHPSASATIISHRMKDCDWRWVLTSDI